MFTAAVRMTYSPRSVTVRRVKGQRLQTARAQRRQVGSDRGGLACQCLGLVGPAPKQRDPFPLQQSQCRLRLRDFLGDSSGLALVAARRVTEGAAEDIDERAGRGPATVVGDCGHRYVVGKHAQGMVEA
jgi:hypothetical protein